MGNFSNDIKKWSKKTKDQQREIVTLVFQRLGTLIVNRTPIGDVSIWAGKPPADYRPGTLVNSWYAGIGESSESLVRSPNITGADSLTNINAIASQAYGKLAYITNPAPYARRIEYGWSTQAPQGMVRLSVRDFKAIVTQVVNNVI